MCLIAIARKASALFPFVLAANREEAYDRPTVKAGVWEDDPRVVGGRDGLAGGSWLALRDDGRFAAVTNVRGSTAPAGARSRGLLVRDFVTGMERSLEYERYAGFHLIAGDVSGAIVHYTNSGGGPITLTEGIHAITNAPGQEVWPSATMAIEALRAALAGATDVASLTRDLLAFLRGEVFVTGERYGTRSSTVIVATASGEIHFVEQDGVGASLFAFSTHRGESEKRSSDPD